MSSAFAIKNGLFASMELINRGASSLLYKTEWRGRTVAVKRLDPEVAVSDPKSATRFWKEGATLARIRHPSLPQIFSLHDDENGIYIIMEYIEGLSLADMDPSQAGDNQVVRKIIEDVCGGLVAVHDRNMIHRDIKPANIIVTPTGDVRLIDFGFASEIQGEETGEYTGSVLYSSPEQLGFIGFPLDGRSDLFSLGVVAYELLTGDHPFRANDLQSLMQSMTTSIPPDAREIRSSVDGELAAIVQKLLASDPAERFSSAAHVLSALNARKIDRGNAYRPALQLAGRESQLDRLAEAYNRAKKEHGQFILIEGLSGCGKSALVRAFFQQSGLTESEIAAVKCNPESVPLAAVQEAFRTYVENSGNARTTEILQSLAQRQPRRASELGEFDTRFKRFQRNPQWEKPANVDSFYEAIANLFADLSEIGGLRVLYIDDIQWLDPSSIAVIEALLEKLTQTKLLILATIRSEETDSLLNMNRLVESSSVAFENVKVNQFTELEMARFISNWLRTDNIPTGLTPFINRHSSGVPLYVQELLQELVSQRLLHYVDERWVFHEDQHHRLNLSANVLNSYIGRLTELGDQEWKVLKVLAVSSIQLSSRHLAEIVALDERKLNESYEVLRENGFIDLKDRGYIHFSHDKIKEAVSSTLDPQEIKSLHLGLAVALPAFDEEVDPLVLAYHYENALPDDRLTDAVEVFQTAGDIALGQYAFEEAYRYLSKVYKDTRDNAGWKLISDLAAAATESGRATEAIVYFQEAIQRCPSRVTRAKLHTNLALRYTVEWHTQKMVEQVRLASSNLGLPDPKTIIGSMAQTLLCIIASLTLWPFRRALPLSWIAYLKTMADFQFVAAYVCYFGTKALPFTLALTRSWFVALLLPICNEKISAIVGMSGFLGMLKLKRVSDHQLQTAIDMAALIGSKRQQAKAHYWHGALVATTQYELGECTRWFKAMLARYGRWIELGDQYAIYTMIIFNALMRGKTEEVLQELDTFEKALASVKMEETDALSHPLRALLMVPWLHSLQESKVQEYRNHFEKYRPTDSLGPIENIIYRTYCLAVYYETGDCGDDVDDMIEEADLIANIPELALPHFRPFFIYKAYLRLMQCEQRGSNPADKDSWRALCKAYRQLQRAANVDYIRVHRDVVGAAIARIKGRHDKAYALLGRALQYAAASDSAWGRYEVLKERAKLSLKLGRTNSARDDKTAAANLAHDYGWMSKLDLDQDDRAASLSPSSRSNQNESRSRHNYRSKLIEERLRALLEINLDADGAFDPKQRAKVALATIARIANAERAALYLIQDGQLTLEIARDEEGDDVKKLKGISQTALKTVMDTRAPVLVANDQHARAIGSESIVLHSLRSVLVVPIILQDRFYGIIYLDNRIVRGVFREEHIDLVRALGHQVAISIEGARTAQVELQRRELQKDLEITAAIQTTLLPKSTFNSTPLCTMSALYTPAEKSGGDWWYSEYLGNGKQVVITADVTGHGVGPAMMTALLAGTYFSYRSSCDSNTFSLQRLFEIIRTTIAGQIEDRYWVAATGLLIDINTRKLSLLNAGGPFPMHVSANRIKSIAIPGNPLCGVVEGSDTVTMDYNQGDRIVLFSDGIPEMRLTEKKTLRQIGWKKIIEKTLDRPIEETAEIVRVELESARGKEPLCDDITLVAMQFK